LYRAVHAIKGSGGAFGRADLSALPEDASEADWEESFLSWSIDVTTDASEMAMRQAFDFATKLYDFEISPLFSQGAADASQQAVIPPRPVDVAAARQSQPERNSACHKMMDVPHFLC
jgi:hypothetical protein